MKFKKLEWSKEYGAAESLIGLFVQIILTICIFAAIVISAFIVEKGYIIFNITTVTAMQTLEYVMLLTVLQWILIILIFPLIFKYTNDT